MRGESFSRLRRKLILKKTFPGLASICWNVFVWWTWLWFFLCSLDYDWSLCVQKQRIHVRRIPSLSQGCNSLPSKLLIMGERFLQIPNPKHTVYSKVKSWIKYRFWLRNPVVLRTYWCRKNWSKPAHRNSRAMAWLEDDLWRLYTIMITKYVMYLVFMLCSAEM
jgi:hypothetical protein